MTEPGSIHDGFYLERQVSNVNAGRYNAEIDSLTRNVSGESPLGVSR